MTFVVTENCIKCNYTDCVEVCPVDCSLCVPECPVDVIYDEVDLPEEYSTFIKTHVNLQKLENHFLIGIRFKV